MTDLTNLTRRMIRGEAYASPPVNFLPDFLSRDEWRALTPEQAEQVRQNVALLDAGYLGTFPMKRYPCVAIEYVDEHGPGMMAIGRDLTAGDMEAIYRIVRRLRRQESPVKRINRAYQQWRRVEHRL